MKCQECQHRLLEWAEGELEENLWIDVSEHLQHCLSCRREAEVLARILEALKELNETEEVSSPPVSLWGRLPERRIRAIGWSLALVATLTLAFAMGWKARGISLPLRDPNQTVVTDQQPRLQDRPIVVVRKNEAVKKNPAEHSNSTNRSAPPKGVAPKVPPSPPRPSVRRRLFPRAIVRESEAPITGVEVTAGTEWVPVILVPLTWGSEEQQAQPYRISVTTRSPASGLERTLVKEWTEEGNLSTQWMERLTATALDSPISNP
ncbi:MAG: hypothetical protein NZ959_09795 [Armatimonadetes bacterium]|nr:hypothetical protein [Armatimonadota bacterium]MDW8122656.1 hypothetical protein [Armatimonadota bacterium]